MRKMVFFILITFLLAGYSIAGIDRVTLLTDEEAAMPDAPKKPFDVARTFNNGPDIKVILPVLNKEYKVPVRLVVRFIPQNSKEVDISKFKVECLKFISINITEKILPYTTKEGITMENAQLPAGQYTFRLTIGDVAGGITQETFQVKVVD